MIPAHTAVSVSFFEREAFGEHSIERLFEAIRDVLPGAYRTRVVRCPTPFHSRWFLPSGICRAWRRRDTVNHIAGDIHYVALGLPGKNSILTVHDLNRLDQLEGLRRTLYKWLYFTLPVRRCRFVTTISEHTRDRLVALCPSASGKVTVIPPCITGGLHRSPKAFHGAKPRVLHLGTAPNKNLERLIHALEGESCRLHVIGRLSDAQRSLLDSSRIEYENAADVSDAEVAQAYRDCDLVVFASLAEGFGLPIIEGQVVGRPVVTSDIAPMNAVAGSAACLVDPRDIASIRAGIRRVIADADFRDSLIRRGFENARKYSPEAIASAYERLYEKVFAGA